MTTKKLKDGWVAYMEGDREIIRIKPPEGGFTRLEAVQFGDHILELARRQGAGNN